MPDFSKRSSQSEIMDDLTYSGTIMDQTLAELEIINRWLGGNEVTINGISTLLKNHPVEEEVRIADLGCGRGDILKVIQSWGKRNGRFTILYGFDANPYIIQLARQNLDQQPQIQLHAVDIFSQEFRSQRFDIVIGTLFYHHFTNQQLEHFFKQLKEQVSIGFIINDIHRHPLAFYFIKLLTTLFSQSSMVKYDAPLSVLRAFKKKELAAILQRAGIVDFTIKWKWAFRWQVLVRSRSAITHL